MDIQRDSQNTKEYFIGEPYPPSIVPLNKLESTTISDLEANQRKHNNVLFVRTLDLGIRAAGIHNIVEDVSGNVERLVLYNSPATSIAQSLLSEQEVFAVKEPSLEVATSGSSCIRVDHPSDLLHIPRDSPLLPAAFRSQSGAAQEVSALDWKTRGNAAYKAGDNLKAVEEFSQGVLVSAPDDITTKQDLLRNRAIANTYLKRFESAVADAKAAVIEGENLHDDRVNNLNAKSYFRAGRAAYELRNMQDAKDCLTQALKLTPDDKDAQRELARVERRINEILNGEFDFLKIAKSVSTKRNRLDHADFLSNVVVRDAGSHGNGLFAAKDIAAGGLILCEKALCVAFDSDQTSLELTVLDPKSHRQLTGTQASLLFELVAKLLHSPETARNFFNIYDAGYEFKTSSELVDDTVPVDVFRVQAIVQHNSFGCPNPSSTDRKALGQVAGKSGYPSTGLWVTAAYTNHACVGNAMRAFIGDMMIMHATRDIKQGEEILMPYRLPDVDHDATQAELKKIWGFACDCVLCVAEAKSSQSQREVRLRLNTQNWDFLDTNVLQKLEATKEKELTRLTKRKEHIAKTYDNGAFEGIPRLALANVTFYLSHVYHAKSRWANLVQSALDALEAHGLEIHTSEQELTVFHRQVHLVRDTVELAMLAKTAYRKLDQPQLADQMQTFAGKLYQTLYGTLQGFVGH